jgi:hypothetical protein
MIRKLLYILLFSGLICTGPLEVRADTGTYEIRDYRVELYLQSDGQVKIDYYQKWFVTGGHIPWITVGTANSSFTILNNKDKGNISTIYPNNQQNWFGVRINLDKDYGIGESFEVKFSILQKHLLSTKGNRYILDFTPGWYDRAVTGKLFLGATVPCDITQVSIKPRPDRSEGRRLIWERTNLDRGKKFNIKIYLPKTLFSNVVLPPKPTIQWDWTSLVAISFVFGFIIFILIMFKTVVRSSTGNYGKGGSVYYPGIHTGTVYGGSHSSACACACVSCVCACACAGGSAAGCDRKLFFRHKNEKQQRKIKNNFPTNPLGRPRG